MSPQQRVRAAVNEFESNVETCLARQIDISHAESIACIESARIPQQGCRLRPGVRRGQRSKRKNSVTVLASACRDGGNQCMPQAVTEPGAAAAIVKRVFVKDFSQTVAGRLRHQVDAKIACDPHTVSVPALTPVRGPVTGLLDAGCGDRSDDGIRSE